MGLQERVKQAQCAAAMHAEVDSLLLSSMPQQAPLNESAAQASIALLQKEESR